MYFFVPLYTLMQLLVPIYVYVVFVPLCRQANDTISHNPSLNVSRLGPFMAPQSTYTSLSQSRGWEVMSSKAIARKHYGYTQQGLLSQSNKERSCEILKLRGWSYGHQVTLKFDRHLSRSAAEMSVKYQSNWIALNSHLMTLRFHEFWW